MTKKLEELFNLDDKIEETPVETTPVKEHTEITSLDDSYKAVEAITRDLPVIRELDHLDDSELDTLASKAEKAYDDLMDLGMNVEARYGSKMFEVAANMLNAAITAKTNKIEKKLKMVDLQLKKYAIDKKNSTETNNEVQGEGYILTDRNSILEKLKNLK